MGTSGTPIEVPARNGLAEPSHVGRSVASGDPFDGSIVAHPAEPGAPAGDRTEIVEGCDVGERGPADEVVVGHPGARATNAGFVGVLGKPSSGGDGAVHPDLVAAPALRPTTLVRLLNSTSLGQVISERQLLRHRVRAGKRIGEGRRVDLLRYTAWLAGRRHDHGVRIAEPDARPSEGIGVRDVLWLARRQDFRCALTGRRLQPETAALDHMLSVARGGRHCIENAQMLHKDVNRAKGTLTNEEFVTLCREVVAWADCGPGAPT